MTVTLFKNIQKSLEILPIFGMHLILHQIAQKIAILKYSAEGRPPRLILPFLLCINDLVDHLKYVFYADDTHLIIFRLEFVFFPLIPRLQGHVMCHAVQRSYLWLISY